MEEHPEAREGRAVEEDGLVREAHLGLLVAGFGVKVEREGLAEPGRRHEVASLQLEDLPGAQVRPVHEEDGEHLLPGAVREHGGQHQRKQRPRQRRSRVPGRELGPPLQSPQRAGQTLRPLPAKVGVVGEERGVEPLAHGDVLALEEEEVETVRDGRVVLRVGLGRQVVRQAEALEPGEDVLVGLLRRREDGVALEARGGPVRGQDRKGAELPLARGGTQHAGVAVQARLRVRARGGRGQREARPARRPATARTL